MARVCTCSVQMQIFFSWICLICSWLNESSDVEPGKWDRLTVLIQGATTNRVQVSWPLISNRFPISTRGANIPDSFCVQGMSEIKYTHRISGIWSQCQKMDPPCWTPIFMLYPALIFQAWVEALFELNLFWNIFNPLRASKWSGSCFALPPHPESWTVSTLSIAHDISENRHCTLGRAGCSLRNPHSFSFLRCENSGVRLPTNYVKNAPSLS